METSIKASPYGTLFQCCLRPAGAGQVQRSLRAIGPRSKCVASGGTCEGVLHHFLMGQRFSVVRGPQARCDAVFYLSVRFCTGAR